MRLSAAVRRNIAKRVYRNPLVARFLGPSNINGHPVNPGIGAGPMEAIRAFLEEDDRFAIDNSREKYFMSFNPHGYLKCIK